MKFPCPKCEQPGVSIAGKYRMAYWREAHCSHCNARLCANPWFLAPFSLVYMWLLAACAFVYMFESVGAMAVVYAVIGWVVIDALNLVLIPMSVMRSLEPQGPDADDDHSDQSEQQV